MRFLRIYTVQLLLVLPFITGLHGQNADLLLEDDLLSDLDTLSLFQLMDSLLALEANRTSMISFHLGYTSEVSNAGRTLDVKQYGFSPGVSYFHKNGLYADLTGYWNSELDPHYDLTVLSIGYLGFLSRKLSYSVSYDHSFFTENDPQLDLPPRLIELLLPPVLNNSLSTGLNLDLGGLEARADYAWLFNKESAHRLQLGITGDLKKQNVLTVDRISFRPSIAALWGNEDIISISYSRDLLADTRFPYRISKENSFGVMNYQLRLPLSASEGKFRMVLEYNYNIPQSLPGEKFQYDNNSFFSIDLFYTLAIGAKNSIFE